MTLIGSGKDQWLPEPDGMVRCVACDTKLWPHMTGWHRCSKPKPWEKHEASTLDTDPEYARLLDRLARFDSRHPTSFGSRR